MSQLPLDENANVLLGGSSDALESSKNSNANRNRSSRRRFNNSNNSNSQSSRKSKSKSEQQNKSKSRSSRKSKSKSARTKRNKSKSGTPSYKAKDVEEVVKLDVQDVEEGDDEILSDDEPAFTQQVTKANSPVRKIEDIAVTANCEGMRVFLLFLLVFFVTSCLLFSGFLCDQLQAIFFFFVVLFVSNSILIKIKII